MLDYLVGLTKTTSAPRLALACYLLLIGGWVLYIYLVKGFVWPLIKIKYFEFLIVYRSFILKQTLNSDEVLVLTKTLENLFQVYECGKNSPISLKKLFPKSNLLNENQLSRYEQRIKEKLFDNNKLYKNIQIYNEGRITMKELIRRMEWTITVMATN